MRLRRALCVWCSVSILGIAVQAFGQSTTHDDGTAKGQPVRTPARPVATAAEGLVRLSSDWPAWLTVTLADRIRAESARSPVARNSDDDAYLLNRLRLTAIAKMSSWAQVTVQTQDSRAGWYGVAPVPKSLQNTFDLRLASVALARKGTRGVSAVIGRQELNLGDRRLIASPEWGNVGRTYDGLRVTAFVPGLKVDLFGVAPVDVTPDRFSRAKYGERAFGAWATFNRLRPLGYLDVYQLGKHNYSATGETGTRGDQMVYTTGVLLGGPIGKNVTWEGDTAVQRGHAAGDGISAWATHQGVSWTIRSSPSKPKLGVEYDYASGDDNPRDGVRQTFDQLYASTHGMWGLADQVGWKNMRHAAVKFEFSPVAPLKVNAAVNKLSLATVNDAWYGVSGSRVALNRSATSRDIGWEPDLFAAYTVNRDISVGAGIAVLVSGAYVKQSTGIDRIWTPYVMTSFKF
jgi:Alginate export